MQVIREHSLVFAAILALMPAVVSWLAGRGLARQVEDRSLPERLLFHQRRNGVVMGVAATAIGVISPVALLWAAPLLFTSQLLAGYPLRRALFEDTWSAGTYLSFFHRLTFGIFGFWILLAALPFLASLAGPLDWLAGAVLAAVLIVWERHYARVLRACLRAAPLEDGPMRDRCGALALAFGMPQPEYLRVDLRGGIVANALALPSLRGNGVVFSDTLLTRLSLDEVAAICAHELAHFEYFNPVRLRRLRAVSLTLILMAALMTPMARVAGLAESALPSIIWFGALAAALAARAKDKQRQETVCDQRAVAVIGDGEPLISALSKIYALARIPRRMEGRQEQAGSHPSLSRRIRDIRTAAGSPPAPLTSPVSIQSSDGRASATFEASALHWVEHAGLTHVLSYGHLTELRLEPHGRRGPRLRASNSAALKWEMTVAPADVARLQDVLDRVDGQLGDAPAPRGIPAGVGRLFVLFTSLLALSLGQIAVSVIALLAWFVPATPLLSAAGVAAMVAAALGLRDQPASGMSLALIPASAGLVLIWLARQARRGQSRNPRPLIAVLGTIALLLVASVTLGGLDPIRLHMAARSTPAVVVVWVALAAALACAPGSAARVVGLAAAVVATAAAAIASESFLDRFGDDPFLVESQRLRWIVVDPDRAQEFPIPQNTSGVQLSPGGLSIAALQGSESEEETPTFQVGLAGGGLSPLSGDDVQFVDDHTLLIMDSVDVGVILRQVRIDPPHEELWRQPVPDLYRGTLSIVRGTGKWRVNGFDREEALVHAEGTIGTSELRERRWPAGYTRDAWIEAVTADGRDPLVIETSYDNGLFDYLPSRAWALGLLLNTGSQQSRYWSIGDNGVKPLGSSRLGASCAAGLEGALACSVYDGTRTRFFRLAADSGTVTGFGWLDGRFIGNGAVADGWRTGWIGSTAVAIDLLNARVLRVPRSEGRVGQLAVSGRRLAAMVFDGGSYHLRIYEIDPPVGEDGRRADAAVDRGFPPAIF
jgi:Zn-dependent protease with chaperone function